MAAGRVAEVRLAALTPLLAEIERTGLHWLTDDERARWSAMRSEIRRSQFLAGHWLIRCLAAETLGGEPAQWLLRTEPDGSPMLRSRTYNAGQGVSASLSHSKDWLAAALAPFPVGVDLEYPTKHRDFLALADTAFSSEECTQLRNLPESERPAVFYLYWTLKEATGKRAGHGLRLELARRQRPIECAANETDVVSWQFADCNLALAGEAGMSIRATGIPEAVVQRFWRIESATT